MSPANAGITLSRISATISPDIPMVGHDVIAWPWSRLNREIAIKILLKSGQIRHTRGAAVLGAMKNAILDHAVPTVHAAARRASPSTGDSPSRCTFCTRRYSALRGGARRCTEGPRGAMITSRLHMDPLILLLCFLSYLMHYLI